MFKLLILIKLIFLFQQRIIELASQPSETQNGASRDLLENAIGPEHPGRVRALGCTPSQYFGKSSSAQVELERLKEEIKNMKEDHARVNEQHAREMAELREEQRKFMDDMMSRFMSSG
jgi:hypothetical protein